MGHQIEQRDISIPMMHKIQFEITVSDYNGVTLKFLSIYSCSINSKKL